MAAEGADLLVRGGVLVDAGWRGPADVLVLGGRIVALGAAGTLNAPADAEVLDAGGAAVLPGLVDAHVHVRDPGLTHKEDIGTATSAAVAGGVTTVLVMPYDDPPADSAEALIANARHLAGRAFADFGLQGAVGPRNADAVASLAGAGAVSLEVQLADAHPAVGAPDAWSLTGILRSARRARVPVGIYCETGAVADGARAELVKAGRRDSAAHGESRPALGEELGAYLACRVAAETGAAVHLRQISTAAAVAVADSLRARGADITVETTPHYLSLTAADAAVGGPGCKVLPPLRTAEDRAALLGALRDGRVDIVATDHAPHAPAEKAAGDMWRVPGGFPGLETMLPVLLDLLGESGLELVARACAARPAVRFGLGWRKGRIAPGFDGDLVVVDPRGTTTVAAAALRTRASASPYAGRELAGSVRVTVLRGRVAFRDGSVVDPPGGGWLRPD